MRLRQEQTVFIASAAVLALLVWNFNSDRSASIRGGRSSQAAEFEDYAPPDIAHALTDESFAPPLSREVFEPPRDTRPLPPLELAEPPRLSLAGLLPPTDPGPSPQSFGRLLRRTHEPVDLPDLFDSPEDDFEFESDEDFMRLAEEDEEPQRRSLIRTAADEEDLDPYADETPAERAARFAGYRGRYDWIRRGPGDVWFGRIQNEDRYRLLTDPDLGAEPLLFVRLKPETGREWFENITAPPLVIERDSFEEFGFAETATNELEVRRLEIGQQLSRSSYDAALALAVECVRRRLEAPRALAIAEELFLMARDFDREGPIPRLGLAACLEAGFRFEEAFREYKSLLADFSHREEVHVRLARLEERFLLLEEAEQRFHEALSMDRSSWVARFGLGGFLARRGRYEEAVPHLVEANRHAPQDPDKLFIRVEIRSLLGDVHFALGDLDEAGRLYAQALSADPTHQRSKAGLLATRILGEAGDGVPIYASAEDTAEEQGFEMLLTRGVAAILEGQYVRSRELLELAEAADPLRADRALAALSYLAEVTGHPDEALGYAAQALERNPENAYALFQSGRLRGHQDDYEGARGALLAALDQELDFEDALVVLGETAFELGQFEDAERYLERAIFLNPGRPEVHTLRGLNFLQLGSVPGARSSFDAALELDPEDSTAAGGRAWCTYLTGETEQAIIQLGAIDDRRRRESADDPWRVWARAQIERIQDHQEKVEWTDSFDRTRLLNDWQTREGAGPIVSMEEGAAKIEGVFRTTGATRIYREYPAGLFVSIEADVWIQPGKANVRAGLFVARERRRANESEIVSEASASRHSEGGLQVRFVRSAQESTIGDMEQPFPTGRWVRLRIERTGEASDSAVTIYFDGIPLVQNQNLASLGRASTPLLVGLFVEGETAREVEVKMDNCAVVYRGAE